MSAQLCTRSTHTMFPGRTAVIEAAFTDSNDVSWLGIRVDDTPGLRAFEVVMFISEEQARSIAEQILASLPVREEVKS